jgi:hypothetical protein
MSRSSAVRTSQPGASFSCVASSDSLTPEQRAWLIADEKRWQRAFEIAGRHHNIDAGGVYRVLRNLEKTPAERLKAALMHGRLLGFHRR